MPFCIECGSRITDGTRLCPLCDPAAKQDVCHNCGQPFAAAGVKFCMKCGTPRSVALAPASIAPTGPAPVGPRPRLCPNCQREASTPEAAFCIWCSAKLPPGPAAAGPSTPPPPSPAKPPAQAVPPALPLTPEMRRAVEEAEELRLGVYQNVGRLILTACRQGTITKDRLPADLASEIDKAFATLKNGHDRLIGAGVCPLCKDTRLHSGNGSCQKCGQKFSRVKGEIK